MEVWRSVKSAVGMFLKTGICVLCGARQDTIAICSSRRYVHSLCRLSVCRTEVCVETTSVVDTHELLSFEDREQPYREGAWVASRLRGLINISDRSELPRHMRKWHWSWVKVGLAREVSDWSRVSHICWLDSDATAVPQLEYMSDPTVLCSVL